jgi:hypothetical protein
MLNESSLCRGCEAGDEEDGHVLRVGSVEGVSKESKEPSQNIIRYD